MSVVEPPRRFAPAPQGGAVSLGGGPARDRGRVWLFDLDNTLHDASHAAFGMLDVAINDYIARELEMEPADISIERMRMFGALRPKPDARMLRFVLARLKLPPARCVLIEDTLAHQRAARGVGIKSVWMQRYLRGNSHGSEVGGHVCRKPAYVCARINSMQALRKL